MIDNMIKRYKKRKDENEDLIVLLWLLFGGLIFALIIIRLIRLSDGDLAEKINIDPLAWVSTILMGFLSLIIFKRQTAIIEKQTDISNYELEMKFNPELEVSYNVEYDKDLGTGVILKIKNTGGCNLSGINVVFLSSGRLYDYEVGFLGKHNEDKINLGKSNGLNIKGNTESILFVLFYKNSITQENYVLFDIVEINITLAIIKNFEGEENMNIVNSIEKIGGMLISERNYGKIKISLEDGTLNKDNLREYVNSLL